MPDGFRLVAHSDACPNVAICDEARGFYGVQFHPEVNHTRARHATCSAISSMRSCGAVGDWTMADYKETAIDARSARRSAAARCCSPSPAASIPLSLPPCLAEAVGNQLTCVFVDHGLMRNNEGDEVEEAFSKWDLNFIRVNAEERFLDKLTRR